MWRNVGKIWRNFRKIWEILVNFDRFCHNLRAFMWRKIEPKSTFLEIKWQISGLAHCALSASPCISNFMIRQFLSLGTPPHYTTWFTTIGRLLAPAQLLSSQLPLSELYLPDSRFASRPLGLGSLYFSLLGEESWPKSLFIHCVSIFRYGLWLGKKTLGENKWSKNLSSKKHFRLKEIGQKIFGENILGKNTLGEKTIWAKRYWLKMKIYCVLRNIFSKTNIGWKNIEYKEID